jgi:exodeoxyribonuclease VII large subunit
MTQIPLFNPLIWTISELTLYLRDLIESDQTLQDIWIQGEISNFSRPSSGHLYFTLKDNNSSLRCVMWRNASSRLNFIIREGLSINVHGSISIYEIAGQYQLYADAILLAGEGDLYQEFLRLKTKLELEGLFTPDRKRSVPLWPHCIGVVTSPSGAAIHDILTTISRRYPLVDVVLAPTPVQGSEAPPAIIAALQLLNEMIQPDIIVVARGGGSIEDLSAFNDERVARAIFASQAPVICGIGHETDFTIADFVADIRAPTPTAAAELATPNSMELVSSLTQFGKQLVQRIRNVLNSNRYLINNYISRLSSRTPRTQLRTDHQRLDDLLHREGMACLIYLKSNRYKINSIQQRLNTINPSMILNQGYAIVTTYDGKQVRNIIQVSQGDNINILLKDGKIDAIVKSIIPLG